MMHENVAVKEREKWIDYVKVIACILVVLGHFFQSMTKANILPENNLYKWFEMTIYYFHVPLFFICSGYLYQKYSRVTSVDCWCKNILKKALALGVPYMTFSTATWVLKRMFSSSVNDRIGGLGDTLFFHPTAPYWYLYTLLFIFIITPTFCNNKVTIFGLAISFVAKILILIIGGSNIYVISTVLSNEIWFVLGMSICVFNIHLKDKKMQGMISGCLFVIFSVVIYMKEFHNEGISLAMGLLACEAVIVIVASFENKFGKGMELLAKYTMPIFLMHTLFAAPIRSILLKLNINNALIHVVIGLSISFSGPIVANMFIEKTKWLEFFLYPNKVLNSISKQK